MPTVSSVAPPEPNIVTLDDDSNDPTIAYEFKAQQPIVPPSLNDFNLPPNPLNILAAMTVVQQKPTQHDNNYSSQSPEPSDSSPISTTPKKLSTLDGWERPHSTTDDNILSSEDERRRVHWTSLLDELFHSEGETRRVYLLSSPSPPSRPRIMKRKLEKEMCFPKK